MNLLVLSHKNILHLIPYFPIPLNKSSELNNKWIVLQLNFAKGKCSQATLKTEFQGKDNVNYEIMSEQTLIPQRLDMEFVESGMKQRIEKALLHIIKQYGGNAIVKKEPF